MTQELRSKIFDSLGKQLLYLRLMPSRVVNQRNIFPSESEHGQKAFVDLVDIPILPITRRVIGLGTEEVITKINAQHLQASGDRAGSAAVHSKHQYSA